MMPKPENVIGKGFDKRPHNINRAGRPPGTRNRMTIVREALERLHETGIPNVEVATAIIVKKAVDGDVQAWDKLMDSGYGKVVDKSEITGTDGGPIKTQQELSDIDKAVLAHYFKTKGVPDAGIK